MEKEPEISTETFLTLVKMREIIQRGWCQDAYFKKGQYPVELAAARRVCLLGARAVALQDADIVLRFGDEVTDLLAAAIGEPGKPEYLTVWNDAPGRRQRHVLALIDSILARARK